MELLDKWLDIKALRAMLDDLMAGRRSADDVVARLRRLPFADVGGALVDHHRELRQGMPEAVYGPGKSPEQCVRIIGELLTHGTGPVLLTRATVDQVKAVLAEHGPARHHGRTLLYRAPPITRSGRVLVVTAGVALWNMGVAYLAGLLLHHGAQRGILRL